MEPGQISVQYRPLLAGIKNPATVLCWQSLSRRRSMAFVLGNRLRMPFVSVRIFTWKHRIMKCTISTAGSLWLFAFLYSWYRAGQCRWMLHEFYGNFRTICITCGSCIWDQRRSKKRFGFTVNIGISDVKVLAKMASDFEKPDRVHTLFRKEIQEKCGRFQFQIFLWQGIPVWRHWENWRFRRLVIWQRLTQSW